MREWVSVKRHGVLIRLREGVCRAADHSPHIEVEATCEGHTIIRFHTVAANPHRKPEHLERDLDKFIQQVAEECAGHGHSRSLIKDHLGKLRQRYKQA